MQESIIDITRSTLDPAVFEGDPPVLRERVRAYILKQAKPYEQYGNVESVNIDGSILSRQWHNATDIDITLVMRSDTEEDLEDAQSDGYATQIDPFILPGTGHPVTYYVESAERYNLNKYDGVYDVINNGWLKGPYDLSVDVLEYWDEFLLMTEDFDNLISKLKRSLIDYEVYELVTDIDTQIVDEKLVQINEVLNDLLLKQSEVIQLRKNAFEGGVSGNLSKGNVIFKLLQKYRYLDLLWGLYARIERWGRVETPQQVKDVYDFLASY